MLMAGDCIKTFSCIGIFGNMPHREKNGGQANWRNIVNTKKVDSLGGFVAAVRELRTKWKCEEWRLPERSELWFRAEDASHKTTRLQPCLYRPVYGKKSKSIEDLLLIEGWMFDEFERCATQLCDVKPGQDWEWEWYFLMQHHGVPTRLLDWTDGSLIGLHFAVFSRSHIPSELRPLVYVLDPYWLNETIIQPHRDRKDAQERWKKYCKKHPDADPDEWERLYVTTDKEDAKDHLLDTPEIPMLWDSPHVTRRVAAQRSRFMIFGRNPTWLSDLTEERHSRIEAIEIETAAIHRIRHELRDAGMTESVIFP